MKLNQPITKEFLEGKINKILKKIEFYNNKQLKFVLTDEDQEKLKMLLDDYNETMLVLKDVTFEQIIMNNLLSNNDFLLKSKIDKMIQWDSSLVINEDVFLNIINRFYEYDEKNQNLIKGYIYRLYNIEKKYLNEFEQDINNKEIIEDMKTLLELEHFNANTLCDYLTYKFILICEPLEITL